MSSVRKKRNFKGLQLGESPLSSTTPSLSASSSSSSALASSNAAAAAGLSGSAEASPSSASSSHLFRTINSRTTPNSSTLSQTSSYPQSAIEIESASGASYHNTLTEQLKNLELGVEYKLDLKNEDLKVLNELGSGNGGTVCKVVHEKTGTVMAKKTVFIDAKPAVRKQILRELQILHECNSPYIVSFYGAYMNEPHICMCMEYMDKSSLDTIWKKWGPIPADICGQVGLVVVHGLTYLYDVHRIIHRDVKPSNILVNSQGQIKLCDFGVSGELINSIADTFVGTSTYMSPERIQGDQYSVKSDVWSLGITIIELALGRFPFAEEGEDSEEGYDYNEEDDDDDLRGTLSPSGHSRRSRSGVSLDGGGGSSSQMSMLELLQRIVNEPPPRLPASSSTSSTSFQSSSSATSGSGGGGSRTKSSRITFPEDLCAFVDLCVSKDPNVRPTPKELTKQGYMVKCEKRKETGLVDVKGWVDRLV
ncbi:Pkinase-domain-containing protein [Microstroma glucosiphilum]|uniref:Pkinase-domain-containing protein n=1 Tax=Pseudomicrostroma glucosiphilum TaxID=1684307 RepID=A0A316U0B0_9BASI|nr:Pkinase-domain-containing protein [Pseudomicrostroma glucosiphilum]PWN18849.1 Pkinase-domain-containing protein [Pseudomicrostroma glucosiphilum]